MARTMKAAVVHEFGKPLTIDEVPVPTPEYGEIVVKIAASITAPGRPPTTPRDVFPVP
jgi:Zn-dependent alcohol dehydrogenase